MNTFIVNGRLTKDPELQKTPSGVSISRITLAVDRQAKDAGADFLSITCFSKTAENIVKYTAKGQQLLVTGHIQSGDYEKDGKKVYTTSLIADKVEFLSSKKGSTSKEAAPKSATPEPAPAEPEIDYAPVEEIAGSDDQVW